MTAACNKFLRIYYARVKEYLDSLDAKSLSEASANAEAKEPSKVSSEISNEILEDCITAANPADNIDTYAQDRATQECDPSGVVGLSKPTAIGEAAARTA